MLTFSPMQLSNSSVQHACGGPAHEDWIVIALFIVLTGVPAARPIIPSCLVRAVQVQTSLSTPPFPNTTTWQMLLMIPVSIAALFAAVVIIVHGCRRRNTRKKSLFETNNHGVDLAILPMKRSLSDPDVNGVHLATVPLERSRSDTEAHGVDLANVPTDDSHVTRSTTVAFYRIGTSLMTTEEEDDADDIEDEMEQAGPEEVEEQEEEEAMLTYESAAASVSEPHEDMQRVKALRAKKQGSPFDAALVIPLSELANLARRPSNMQPEEEGFVRKRANGFDQREELFRLSEKGVVRLQGLERHPSGVRSCVVQGSVNQKAKFFD